MTTGHTTHSRPTNVLVHRILVGVPSSNCLSGQIRQAEGVMKYVGSHLSSSLSTMLRHCHS